MSLPQMLMCFAASFIVIIFYTSLKVIFVDLSRYTYPNNASQKPKKALASFLHSWLSISQWMITCEEPQKALRSLSFEDELYAVLQAPGHWVHTTRGALTQSVSTALPAASSECSEVSIAHDLHLKYEQALQLWCRASSARYVNSQQDLV